MSAKTSKPVRDWQGPSLRTVLGGIAFVSVAMGVLAYYRYVESEKSIMGSMPAIEAAGADMTPEQCITAVLGWHKECEGLSFLCNDAVTKMMFHCLRGQDRADECAALKPDEVSKGQWVFYQCRDRGTECKHRKQCPCADAYRAFDSFCRTDQAAVQVAL